MMRRLLVVVLTLIVSSGLAFAANSKAAESCNSLPTTSPTLTGTSVSTMPANPTTPTASPSQPPAPPEADPASGQNPNPGDKSALDKLLPQLQEVYKKRITLAYLADPRSKDFVKSLLADLPVQTRTNMRANMSGKGHKALLDNFTSKWGELTDDIVSELGKSPDRTGSIIDTMEKSTYPMDLGFGMVARKMAQAINFRLSQDSSGDQAGQAQDVKSFKVRLDALVTRMTAEGAKDPYDSVKSMYSDVAHRDFPIWWFDDETAGEEVTYVTHGGDVASSTMAGKHKMWTVLVFVNANNNLESSGIGDLKEMEKVGSTDKVNIITELARLSSGEGNDISNDNWVGARRYEVVKNLGKKIGSRMVGNLGQIDMGSKNSLADFLTWGVQNYPADRYLAIIWNHGAGWIGISQDDTTGHIINLPDLTWALQQGQAAIAKVNPKHPKFDVIDFDACLMGMVEIAWQLRDITDVMIGSEETEPGNGMPYSDYLRPMTSVPTLSTRSLAKQMVAAYVKSYTPGGSQTDKYEGGDPVTKAAYDLSKMEPLVKAIDRLGKSLIANFDTYSASLAAPDAPFAKIRRYGGDDYGYVDLVDFARKLISTKMLPDDAKKACQDIVDLSAYPIDRDRLAEPVNITSKNPGFVVWGYNGWKIPPQAIWPHGTEHYQTRFVRTPLQGPDAAGLYSCVFGPFTVVSDPMKANHSEFVTELDYRLETSDGQKGPELVQKTGKMYTFVASFPETCPLIVEGHTQGMDNSHGMALYYPYAPDFTTSYRALAFSRDTCWADFISRVPQYKRKSSVLLCGPMVEDKQSLGAYIEAMKFLQLPIDILWDPKVFNYTFEDIFQQYQDGVVILNGISASPQKTAPTAEAVMNYLNGGGNLFLATQNSHQISANLPLLEEYFKFQYVSDDTDCPSLRMAGAIASSLPNLVINGPDSAQDADSVTIMNCGAPANLWLTTEDGRGAGIAVAGSQGSGKPYRGIYLGLRLESVDTLAARTQIIYQALKFLKPGLSKPPQAVPAASK
ncbi:MAG: hypothetical protein HQM09_16270 [Candidatus Riflebacteria bacterium]|nr:hypothetical protein [Candidatus Riflebacteria bacterium]